MAKQGHGDASASAMPDTYTRAQPESSLPPPSAPSQPIGAGAATAIPSANASAAAAVGQAVAVRNAMPPPPASAKPATRIEGSGASGAGARPGIDTVSLAPSQPPAAGTSRKQGEHAQTRPGASADTAAAVTDSEDDIPDADYIAKAKAKRLQLRQAHIAPDYVVSDSMHLRRAKDYKKQEDAVKQGSDEDGESGGDGDAGDELRLKFTAEGAGGAKL